MKDVARIEAHTPDTYRHTVSWLAGDDVDAAIMAEMLAMFQGDAMIARDGTLMAVFWVSAQHWRIIISDRQVLPARER